LTLQEDLELHRVYGDWKKAGIGAFQAPMTTMIVMLGGNVSAGAEDNIYFKRGQKLVSNAEAVRRVV
jgi:3-keto-5-aminohexanoate cleavage enzyme